jgi:hypothetical protein
MVGVFVIVKVYVEVLVLVGVDDMVEVEVKVLVGVGDRKGILGVITMELQDIAKRNGKNTKTNLIKYFFICPPDALSFIPRKGDLKTNKSS